MPEWGIYIMDREELIKIKNLITSYEGKLLMNYISDFITEKSTSAISADKIQGMCMLFHNIKQIPNEI